MKHFSHLVAVVIGLILGFGLGYALRQSPSVSSSAPPPRYKWRVIDSIPGASIVQYSDLHGHDPLRYLRDDKGLHPVDLGNLSWYVGEKRGKSRDLAIADFINLHNVYETVILRSAQDIPGFKRDNVDPDLQSLSLVPVEGQDVKDPTKTFSVTYTWTAIGGQLKEI